MNADRTLGGLRRRWMQIWSRSRTPPSALGMAVAACLLTVATFGVLLLRELRPEVAFGALYLGAVVAVAARWGRGVTLMTVLAGTLAFAYFRNWPSGELRFADAETAVAGAAMLVAGLTTNLVAERIWVYRDQAPEQWASLDRVGKEHQARRLRIGALLRTGTVFVLLVAMFAVSTRERWPAQAVLVGVYAGAAIWAVVVAFSDDGPLVFGPAHLFVFALADVAVIFGFQLLSGGGYLSLLVLGLAPLVVVPELSWRRVAVVHAIAAAAFAAVLLDDAERVAQLGMTKLAFVILLYTCLCGVSLVAAYAEERHFAEISELNISRQHLLVSTMAAADVLQRRVAEAIHDGALQDLLSARQDLMELTGPASGEHVQRAIESLGEASARLRDAIFELHPVVVEQLGLGPAIEKLAQATEARAGIEIVVQTETETGPPDPVDPIMFAAARELLANVVRHSGARSAVVELVRTDGGYWLDVVDDGVGFHRGSITQRVAEGHIGLASQQARIEAAGGRFEILDASHGSHIRVEVPLRRPVSAVVSGPMSLR